MEKMQMTSVDSTSGLFSSVHMEVKARYKPQLISISWLKSSASTY